jgi:hypothetical protein
MHLKSNNKKSSVLMVCLLAALPALSQQNLNNIQASFNEYRGHALSEKIFTHTDKDFYIAGEILWFKLYVVSVDDNKPVDLSKLAYVEILDKDQKPVLQGKIELSKGTGNGSFYLPGSLNSGIYKLRAYTSWMKNFSADYYFEKPVTIINSLKALDVQPASLRNYDIQFFPEGGSLVQGIQSRVAFKVVDQSGRGVDCKGFLLNNKNDTIISFQSLKFGIGNFIFTPAAGTTYKAVIKTTDTVITRELPTALEQGYVLKVDTANGLQLHITVTTNIRYAAIVYLFIHTRQIAEIAEKAVLRDGTAEFIIDKNKLGEGISHITVFNSESMPVCERLFFMRPTQKLIIRQTIDEQQFASRKKVRITVSSMDELRKSVPADMSVSIFRIDSLHEMLGAAIDNYFWLTSELKGNIESPDYYFSEKTPGTNEAIDNLMLTHGWRRFTWQNVLQHSKPVYNFVPEYSGHIIYGKITNAKTGLPAGNVLAYLSVPGSRVQLYSSRSDPDGNVRFYTKDFYGPNEIVLQTDNRTDTIYKSEIISPFSDKFSSVNLPFFNLSDNMKNLLLDYSVSAQVQNSFTGEKLKQFYAPVIDSSAFFGIPDIQYMLDNYTRFSTMEEVLREYVYEVLVRRQKENFHFIVADVDNKIFLDGPLTLINGVPVFDPNKIIKYDPLKVKKIEIVKRKYFYGPLILNGIVNFVTYQPDPSMLSDLNPVLLEYEGLQYQREFYSPVYETREQVSSRLPDFRNVLYWSPDIQTDAQGKVEINFYTSDLKGKYIVVLQGMNADGRAGKESLLFEVK